MNRINSFHQPKRPLGNAVGAQKSKGNNQGQIDRHNTEKAQDVAKNVAFWQERVPVGAPPTAAGEEGATAAAGGVEESKDDDAISRQKNGPIETTEDTNIYQDLDEIINRQNNTILNQSHIIEKISKYIGKENKDTEVSKKIKDSGGLCAGFAGLWGLYKYLEKESIFWNHLKVISNWDEESLLSPSEETIFEETIGWVCLLQNDQHVLGHINQKDRVLQAGLLGVSTDLANEFSFSAILKRDELIHLLNASLIKQKKMVDIGNTKHALGVFRDGNNFHLYDPNESEVITVDSPAALADTIISQFYGNHRKISFPISASIFGDGESGYPQVNELLNHFLSADSTFLNRVFDGWTPLHWAASLGHTEVAQALIELGADVNAKNKFGETPLHLAARIENPETVLALIAKGADVNQANNDGETPLLLALKNGHIEIAKVLINAGADVNAWDEDGNTPLLLALKNGHTEIAKALIAAGADVNAWDEDGNTLLLLVLKNGHTEIAQALIAKGAKVNLKGIGGWTPLHLAAQEGRTETVRDLIAKGADVNAKDNDGWTPLHLAARYGHTEILEALINAGADVNAKDNDGWTPLFLADKGGRLTAKVGLSANSKRYIEIVKILKAVNNIFKCCKTGKTISPVSNHVNFKVNGKTPLHRAVKYGHDHIVTQLIKSGADVSATDKLGRTPLMLLEELNNSKPSLIKKFKTMVRNIRKKQPDKYAPLEENPRETIRKLLQSAGIDAAGGAAAAAGSMEESKGEMKTIE